MTIGAQNRRIWNVPNVISVARVSTPNQKDNTSPATQHARNRQFAQGAGLTVVQELNEVESGALLFARAMNPDSVIYQALQVVQRGEAAGVVFDVPDRIGRGRIISQLELLFELAGGQVYYASGYTDEVERLGEQYSSEVERRRIRRRLDSGKRRRVEDGYVIATWRPPYGYRFKRVHENGRRVGARLVPVSGELLVWLTGYHWLVGKVDGEGRSRYEAVLVERGIARRVHEPGRAVSLREVARRFTEMGIATPTESLAGAPAGAPWSVQTIGRMYRNPVYAGVYRWGAVERRRVDTPAGVTTRTIGPRPAGDVLTLKVKGVISRASWRRLQDVLRDRAGLGNGRPATHQYLLRGMVRCARCGTMLMGTPVHNRAGHSTRYRCRPERHDGAGAPCPGGRALNGPHVEAVVWGRVVAWLTAPDTLTHAQPPAAGDRPAIRQARAAVAKRLRDLEGELNRLLAFVRGASARTQAAARRQERQLAADIAAAEADLERLDQQQRQAEREAAANVQREAMRADLAERLRGEAPLPFAVRRAVLESIRFTAVWDADAGTLALVSDVGSDVLHARPGLAWVRFDGAPVRHRRR